MVTLGAHAGGSRDMSQLQQRFLGTLFLSQVVASESCQESRSFEVKDMSTHIYPSPSTILSYVTPVYPDHRGLWYTPLPYTEVSKKYSSSTLEDDTVSPS